MSTEHVGIALDVFPVLSLSLILNEFQLLQDIVVIMCPRWIYLCLFCIVFVRPQILGAAVAHTNDTKPLISQKPLTAPVSVHQIPNTPALMAILVYNILGSSSSVNLQQSAY